MTGGERSFENRGVSEDPNCSSHQNKYLPAAAVSKFDLVKKSSQNSIMYPEGRQDNNSRAVDLPKTHQEVCPHGSSCIEGLTRRLQESSLNLLLEDDEDALEAADSAFEEESDYWMSPGLTRQNSCLESVPEHGSLSRRASLLDEDLKEPLSRRASRDSRGPLSRRGSMLDDIDGREPRELGRRDSLLEAVLAAKKGGWKGLVRTDSVESGASMASSLASVSSAGSDGSVCPCDDCLLGLTDLLLASHPLSSRPKK
ncbi:hypothetical protein SK128_010395, partial [Halocaridina rubra]